jgi:hypothetical protein
LITAQWAGIDAYDYARALREGISHMELIRAVEAGMSVRGYVVLRIHGATESEAHVVHRCYYGIEEYCSARTRGLDHATTLTVLKARIEPFGYVKASEAGATFREIRRAVRTGLSPYDYACLLECGASHNEALQVKRMKLSVREYIEARNLGTAHHLAIDQLERSVVPIEAHGSMEGANRQW